MTNELNAAWAEFKRRIIAELGHEEAAELCEYAAQMLRAERQAQERRTAERRRLT